MGSGIRPGSGAGPAWRKGEEGILWISSMGYSRAGRPCNVSQRDPFGVDGI